MSQCLRIQQRHGEFLEQLSHSVRLGNRRELKFFPQTKEIQESKSGEKGKEVDD